MKEIMNRLSIAVLAGLVGVGAVGDYRAAIRIVDDGLHLSSPYLDARVSMEQPAIRVLTIDGLGQGKIGVNALRAGREPGGAA